MIEKKIRIFQQKKVSAYLKLACTYFENLELKI